MLTIRLLLVILATTPMYIVSKPSDQVDYLINQVRTSDCTFIRNGIEHSANDAANHLNLKYSNAKKYARTGIDFIENLASQSSWTGIKYKIKCPNQPVTNTKDWLQKRLNKYLNNQ